MTRVGCSSRCRLGLALVAVCLVLAESLAAANPLRTSERSVGGHGFSESKFRAGGLGGHKNLRNMPPCSHVGDAVNTIAARAYMASTVFIGKVRSKKAAPDPTGLYACNFVVEEVLKDKNNTLLPQQFSRFKYKEKKSGNHRGGGGGRGKGGACYQNYKFSKHTVRANIKSGRSYIVFASGVGPHNLSFFGEPVLNTKRNLKVVKNAIEFYSEANVSGLIDTRVKVRGNLKLVCRSEGSPLPAISWYRNGSRLNTSSNVSIEYRKRRSKLVVKGVKAEDGGLFECRGFTVKGKTISVTANVTVEVPPTETTPTLWPFQKHMCPTDGYCLNGGSCSYIPTFLDFSCECAEGFKGQRCERKDVQNRSNSDPETYEGGYTRIMTFF